MKKRCFPCTGSGRVMGGGMIIKDCDECDGTGKITVIDDELEYLQLKTTDSYKNAIENIKQTANVDNTEAETIFKDELYKLRDDNNKPRRGRPPKQLQA